MKLGGALGHVWWVEIEDVRVEEEAPELESKPDLSPTERLAKLNRDATGDPDDRRIFDLPPEYAGIMYSQFAKSSSLSKIKVGGGETDEWKTILLLFSASQSYFVWFWFFPFFLPFRTLSLF